MRTGNGGIKGLTKWIILLTFILISGISTASATTITVPDDYASIQDAIDAASPGDTVFVKAGNYNEALLIDKPLTLKGAGKNVVTLNGNFEVRSGDVQIEGFQFNTEIYVNI